MAAKKQSRECFQKNRVVKRVTWAKKHRKVPIGAGNMEATGQSETSPGVSGPGSRQLRVEGWMAVGRGQVSDRQRSGVREG